MTTDQTGELTPRKPLRVWPGVAAAVLLCCLRYIVPVVVPDAFLVALIGGLGGALVIVLWWLIFSRAIWYERLGAIVLAVVAMLATSRLVDKSIATGAMGMLLPIYAIPLLALALVAGATAGRRLRDGPRRAVIAAAILLACGSLTLVRTEGIKGETGSQLAFRWSATPEERLLAEGDEDPTPPPSSVARADASGLLATPAGNAAASPSIVPASEASKGATPT